MNANVNEMNTLNSAFDADDVVKPTQQEMFDRFVNLYHEQATIGLDIKALSDEFKEYYPDEDLTTIKAVAKSKAEESLGNKIDKALKFKEIVETFVKWFGDSDVNLFRPIGLQRTTDSVLQGIH